MSNYKTRIVKILGQSQSVPGRFYWILEDGTRIPATGVSDPTSSTVYPFPWHDGTSTVYSVAWGYNGSKVDLDPISASLFGEVLRISSFIRRIKSMKKKLNPLVSGATITYADGSRKTLPVDSMIQEFPRHSAEIEQTECDEPGSGPPAELLRGLKDQASTGPLKLPEEEPVTATPPSASAETYGGRRAYKEGRFRELTAPEPNPSSDNHYYI